MAIQLPNPGLGDGQTGDNEFVMWTKVKDNFNNSTHAASRLVGVADNQLVQSQDTRKAFANIISQPIPKDFNFDNIRAGDYFHYTGDDVPNRPPANYASVYATRNYLNDQQGTVIAHDYFNGGLITRGKQNGRWSEWVTHYHSLNTKIDSKTNLMLKTGDTIPENSAASRLVGTADGRLTEIKENGGVAGTGWGANVATHLSSMDVVDTPSSAYRSGVYVTSVASNEPRLRYKALMQISYTSNSKIQLFFDPTKNDIYMRVNNGESSYGKIDKVYHTGNTQSDTSTNGYIKPSSPIIMLHSDKITANDDGEKMGVKFTKKGIGDYEIAGTTGLRGEGWRIEIPNDLHGNPMVAVTIDEKDGTLNLKSFKRVFNMQTFKFEPDLDSPMDIPEGRWIDLRFNDLPQELINEPIE